MDGFVRCGASWRGKTSQCEVKLELTSHDDNAEEVALRGSFGPLCVVSADRGEPDDTSEVGAVDWLSGGLLLPTALCSCDGRDGCDEGD